MEKYIMNLLAVFNKPIVLGVSFVALSFTTLQLAIILLIGFTLVDFSTGVLASRCRFNAKKKAGQLTEKEIKKGWFSSEKWKLSLLKTITYFFFILLTKSVQEVFKIKTFTFEKYADVEFSITLFAIAICVSIEFYSIFWENLPKAGFNIPKKIVNVFKAFKKIFTTINESEVN